MENSLDRRVFVREIKETFKLEQLTGDDNSLNRWVIVPDVNRPGLELTGYMRINDLKRVTVIGTKELEYIETMDEQTQRNRFAIITDAYTPCIIITKNQGVPQTLIDIANERNFPVFHTNEETYRVVVELVAYLDEKMAPMDVYSGVMMNINGIGVLIKGESGVGKSELALDLVRRGHMLVADDCVEIYRVHNELICKAPQVLENMLEIRGIGVIDVNLVYGVTSCLHECKLDFVIELKRYDRSVNIERGTYGETDQIDILGLKKPLISIPVRDGRSISSIVEAAVANFHLIQKGIDSAKVFQDRQRLLIKSNEKKG